MTARRRRLHWIVRTVQFVILAAAAAPSFVILMAQSRDADDYRFRSLDDRLTKIEAVHPDALVEAVRAQGEAIKTQQTLLWGVLGAVLINVATSNLQVRRRRDGEDDPQRHGG